VPFQRNVFRRQFRQRVTLTKAKCQPHLVSVPGEVPVSQLTTIALAVVSSPFALWLLYCLVVMILRPTSEALQLIMIAGRWFPLRLRSPHRHRRHRDSRCE
jgi:hypothetical protein